MPTARELQAELARRQSQAFRERFSLLLQAGESIEWDTRTRCLEVSPNGRSYPIHEGRLAATDRRAFFHVDGSDRPIDFDPIEVSEAWVHAVRRRRARVTVVTVNGRRWTFATSPERAVAMCGLLSPSDSEESND